MLRRNGAGSRGQGGTGPDDTRRTDHSVVRQIMRSDGAVDGKAI